MSDEISHVEAAAYVPSSEPSSEPAKDYSADVVKDIAEKAWDVIQRSADIDAAIGELPNRHGNRHRANCTILSARFRFD